jgi:prepilin-type N-terminal cleavage/methylation domain-containing protein
MKTEFKARFLQHLNKKRQDKGFTLIELLVVIIIIGILSAIALPSFLNQANKAKQSEAKQYAGSMNRAQQAKYAEDGVFKSQVNDLGIGIKTQTSNYTYTITLGTSIVSNIAAPIQAALKGYTGNVALIIPTGQTDATTVAILCETTKTGSSGGAGSIVAGNSVACAGDQTEVSK